MPFETVSVIGLGYIGLPTAAMFASRKKSVIGVDVNKDVVDTVNRGEIHIVEPDLDMLVHAAVSEGYLKASIEPLPADVFLIAVPTPFVQSESSVPEPDLRFIKSAAEAIAPVIKKGDLIILESTSPVGATEKLSFWLEELRPDLGFPHNKVDDTDIHIAHCPERVLPGHVVREMVENDRVIGGMTPRCSELSVELYKTFVQGDCVCTNARTAEMVKLTENSFRDVNIAFANELSMICASSDINVWELIRLANRHPRVDILQPGPGVGGHCIAVDPWFIVAENPDKAHLIRSAREVNESKPRWVIEKVTAAIDKFLSLNESKTRSGVTVACYGLAFKPNIDDLRESPSLAIVKEIAFVHEGLVYAVEPNVNTLPESLKGVELTDLKKAFNEADIHVLLVDHDDFKEVRPERGVVLDFKGVW